MIYLRDFPDEPIFARMREDYPYLDADGISCFLRIVVAGSEFLTRLDEMLAEFNLTHGRWVILLLLRRRKVYQALPSELAKEQGVSRATISGLIKKLEQQGLLTKKENLKDGRQSMVILTAAGFDLIHQVLPSYYTLIDELMSPLDDSNKVSLKAIMDKLLFEK